MRFTREAYHRMVEAGLLTSDDPVELLDGEIVFRSPIGRRHTAITDRLNSFFAPRAAGRFISRVQGPIALSDVSEPEPDFMLLRHRDDFYAEQDAGPADVALLVEVADSSLAKDLDAKLKLYAAAGIQEYWVVDVRGRSLTIHREPERSDRAYASVTRAAAPQTVAAGALPEHPLDLAWLLP